MEPETVGVVSLDSQDDRVVSFNEPPGGEWVMESPEAFDYPVVARSDDDIERFHQSIQDAVGDDLDEFWERVERFAEARSREPIDGPMTDLGHAEARERVDQEVLVARLWNSFVTRLRR